MHLYRGLLLILVSGIVLLLSISAPRASYAQQSQRLVESVDITGNRRLRKDDILYYVQTRPGDPYNEQQIQRDLQAILALGFFDKTATRVLLKKARAVASTSFSKSKSCRSFATCSLKD